MTRSGSGKGFRKRWRYPVNAAEGSLVTFHLTCPYQGSGYTGGMADTTTQGVVEDWVRDTWMPANLGQPFTKAGARLSAGGQFEFDGVSADRTTVACISTSRHKTSGGGNGTGKWFKLRSDILYLLMADGVTRRLMVLTEPCMFEHYKEEQSKGRVPSEVEAVLAELPAELRDRLAVARERASEEVRPVQR